MLGVLRHVLSALHLERALTPAELVESCLATGRAQLRPARLIHGSYYIASETVGRHPQEERGIHHDEEMDSCEVFATVTVLKTVSPAARMAPDLLQVTLPESHTNNLEPIQLEMLPSLNAEDE